MKTELPEWALEGAEVAEWSRDQRSPVYREHTIVRTTKTQVVLDNGDRWTANQLTGWGKSSGAWSPTYRLTLRDDPEAVAMRRAQRRASDQLQVTRLLDLANAKVDKSPRTAIGHLDQAVVILSRMAEEDDLTTKEIY